MEHRLATPVTAQQLANLRAGDRVYLSGVVYASRDAAHRRMAELILEKRPLPYELAGSAVYYVGPTPERPGEIIGAAGPTTSGRMDSFSPMLLDLGQKIMIGKGARSTKVRDAIVRNGAVYLGAVGGAGALMAEHITASRVLCWEDLGCEALREMVVRELPLTVIIDPLGNDLYELGPAAYLNSLK